uniref:Matrix metallopeptidase 11a n=1 Tax=Paramormyrops kingsleyae TaxID=1676925 RepID=A0A3B3QPU4_9TELE
NTPGAVQFVYIQALCSATHRSKLAAAGWNLSMPIEVLYIFRLHSLRPEHIMSAKRNQSRFVSCVESSWLRHGDVFPFDGPGGVLAHAFFPGTPRQGEIHFDADENWTVRKSSGMDLLNTATHEFGHVLGLHHSMDPEAVMSSFYTFSDPFTLTEDDKQGIQALYGTPTIVRPNVMETNEITPSKVTDPAPHSIPASCNPDACHTDFDAVSVIRGELFFFKSSYVWRLRDGLSPLSHMLPLSYGCTCVLSGHNFWVYNAESRVRGPESVKSLGVPVSDIQATFTWSKTKDRRTYFFKDDKYWIFDPSNKMVESPHPYSTQNWRGFPSNIDAAFQDQQGYANVLSGRQYWKFDPVKKNVLEGYPRYIGVDFFGC